MRIKKPLWERLPRTWLALPLVLVAVALPIGLWLAAGRRPPLRVVLDPPRFVVRSGERVPLHPRLSPAGGEGLRLTWSGQGVEGTGTAAAWRAPGKPGLYSVGLEARHLGTVVKDRVTFRVLAVAPESLPLRRPAPLPAPGPAPGAREAPAGVRADFHWQLLGPGRFRLSAKPARRADGCHTGYSWEFDDGQRKTTARPVVVHRFAGPPRRWHRVTLEVTALTGRARVTRRLMDRSVPPSAPASAPAPGQQ
jgi:hypothetical protein